MATALTTPPDAQTLADLLERLGGISPDRIRMQPPPGTATVDDVIEIESRENRLFELVEGVLVEKAMGYRESLLAGALIDILRGIVIPQNLGAVTGADGMMQLFPGLVRMPDVAFAAWGRFPDGRIPDEPVPHLAPDLAVEVLSRGNTPGEMRRKIGEYFAAGVRLVWIVDLRKRHVTIYTAPDESRVLAETDTLDGGDVLPGFALRLQDLFAELDRIAGR